MLQYKFASWQPLSPLFKGSDKIVLYRTNLWTDNKVFPIDPTDSATILSHFVIAVPWSDRQAATSSGSDSASPPSDRRLPRQVEVMGRFSAATIAPCFVTGPERQLGRCRQLAMKIC